MKILITAFEPFGGDPVNPTMAAIEQLSAPAELVRMVLPTVYGESARRVCTAIAQEAPDAVVMLGLAAGRAAITPERVAVNLADARLADNAGVLLTDTAIRESGPAAYFSTLPVMEICEAMRGIGVPASQSLSAGSFVCNHLFYSVMDHLAERGLSIPAGFIHVPATPEMVAARGAGTASMAMAEIVRGLNAALAVLMGAKKA